MLDKLREPVSGLMQLVAAAAAACGVIGLLYLGRDDLPKQGSLLVYGLSLVLMFLSSAAHHLYKPGPHVEQLLRKVDHASIYLLIAGTYTPICLHFFKDFWQWGLVGIIWALAAVGIGVKLWVINAPRWITVGVYLLMGWLSLIAIQEMLLAIKTMHSCRLLSCSLQANLRYYCMTAVLLLSCIIRVDRSVPGPISHLMGCDHGTNTSQIEFRTRLRVFLINFTRRPCCFLKGVKNEFANRIGCFIGHLLWRRLCRLAVPA